MDNTIPTEVEALREEIARLREEVERLRRAPQIPESAVREVWIHGVGFGYAGCERGDSRWYVTYTIGRNRARIDEEIGRLFTEALKRG